MNNIHNSAAASDYIFSSYIICNNISNISLRQSVITTIVHTTLILTFFFAHPDTLSFHFIHICCRDENGVIIPEN